VGRIAVAAFLAVSLAAPTAGADEIQDPRWEEGGRLEQEGRALERDEPRQAVEHYLEAARLFDEVAREQPLLAQAYWRSARAFWGAGETLPLEAKEERIGYFEFAELRSNRGLEVDPDCAECMLWKFASMGRLRTTRGVWAGIRGVPEMADLLDRAIELNPTYADHEHNSTLGNLHYTSAIFYRVFPDWFWIGWLLGVKGDKERALSHSLKALTLHPSRLDYLVEVGCQFVCLGSARNDPARLQLGREVLRAAVMNEPRNQDEERELMAAAVMLQSPARSCGYTGDTWIEFDRESARRAAVSAR
jgi:tetratricopeptide (TPR) repeat protein